MRMYKADLRSGQEGLQSRLQLAAVGHSQAALLLHLAQQSQSLGPARLNALGQG